MQFSKLCASNRIGLAAAASAKSSANRSLMLYDGLMTQIHISAGLALMPKFLAPSNILAEQYT